MNVYEGMECPNCHLGHIHLIGIDVDIDVFPDRAYWVTYDLYQCWECWRTVHDTEHPVAWIDDAYVPLEDVDPDWCSKQATRRAIASQLQPMLPGVEA